MADYIFLSGLQSDFQIDREGSNMFRVLDLRDPETTSISVFEGDNRLVAVEQVAFVGGGTTVSDSLDDAVT